MNFTNKHNIRSKSLVDALTSDDYDLKDRPDNVFSCTEIIDAPKHQVLKRRNRDIVTQDISDNMWTMFGRAMHYVLDMSNAKASRLSEERLFIEIGETLTVHSLGEGKSLLNADWYSKDKFYVSVKFDSYEDETSTLEDYKFTSTWEVIWGIKEARFHQLNIGAHAMNKIGLPVKTVRPVLLLKDWSDGKYSEALSTSAKFGNICKYPPIPFYSVDKPVWSEDKLEAYLSDRLQVFIDAMRLPDDDIPECTPEERWYRGEAYAVIKVGNKKATKVFRIEPGDDPAAVAIAADAHAANLGKGYFVERRPGVNKRCMKYCPLRNNDNPENSICNFARGL